MRISVDELLSPAARSAAIAQFAVARIDEAGKENARILGRIPSHKVFVDGREGAALESVNPDRGVIVAEFDIVTDVMIWIGTTLQDRSPVVKGDYKRAHTLFADGVEVPIGAVVPVADEYIFLNPVPYARKIEIGKTKSGRDFVIQVPNRIYEGTANDAKRRFSNIASIKFTYMATFGTRTMAYQPSGSRGAHLSRRGGVERAKRVPAIVVRLRG